MFHLRTRRTERGAAQKPAKRLTVQRSGHESRGDWKMAVEVTGASPLWGPTDINLLSFEIEEGDLG
jgi:hypothetical protein